MSFLNNGVSASVLRLLPCVMVRKNTFEEGQTDFLPVSVGCMIKEVGRLAARPSQKECAAIKSERDRALCVKVRLSQKPYSARSNGRNLHHVHLDGKAHNTRVRTQTQYDIYKQIDEKYLSPSI